MDKKILLFLALSAAGYPLCSQAQSQFKLQTQEVKNADNEPAPVFPVPSDRQLKWNETEFYAFYHYGMNTYTDKEWGGGGEPESKFAPTAKPNPRRPCLRRTVCLRHLSSSARDVRRRGAYLSAGRRTDAHVPSSRLSAHLAKRRKHV